MLTRSAWQEVLVQAGFANELAWPAQESSPLRQHLLVARSPGVNRPDKSREPLFTAALWHRSAHFTDPAKRSVIYAAACPV